MGVTRRARTNTAPWSKRLHWRDKPSAPHDFNSLTLVGRRGRRDRGGGRRRPGRLAPLYRVWRREPGAGPAKLPALTCASTGELPSQVKQSALRVGEDLAVTSGAVVYRDAVCEVVQLVVAY
jgi:hypothetical protein